MEWIYPDTITITRINNHAGWSDPGSLGFLRCSHDFESTLEAVLVAGVIRTVLVAGVIRTVLVAGGKRTGFGTGSGRDSDGTGSGRDSVLVAGVIRTVLEASERAATWSEREAVLEASERAAGTEQGALFVGGIDVTANNPKLFSF